MPQLGEIKRSCDVGLQGYKRVIWSACDICGKLRWVRLARFNKSESKICRTCRAKTLPRDLRPRGSNSHRWKGGRWQTLGYIKLFLPRDDFFYPMAKKAGKVFEHRLIMARDLGRCLARREIVHHKNGIRDDNRLNNLIIMSTSEHKLLHREMGAIVD